MIRLTSRFVFRFGLWLALFALAATPAARDDAGTVAAILAAFFLPLPVLYLLPDNLRGRLAIVPEAIWMLPLAAAAAVIWLLAASLGHAGAAAWAAGRRGRPARHVHRPGRPCPPLPVAS